MSESMIERVANVLATRRGSKAVWEEDIATARAAIEAMREPTDAMKEAMTAAALDSEYGALRYEVPDEEIQRVFTAMIDAALAEEPQK